MAGWMLAVAVPLSLAAAWLTACSSVTFRSSGPINSAVPGTVIKHVVIVMQENRTFDNLFNGFPGADTVSTGVSNGVQIPLQPRSLADTHDLQHTHLAWWKDWNHGSMDGFAHGDSAPSPVAYSYVPQAEIEAYWTLAREFTLADRMFQSNTGPSFASHQYMIAGQSADVSGNPSGSIWGCDAAPGTLAPVVGPEGTESPGVFPCFDYQTLADLLDAKGLSWRYYAPPKDDTFYTLSAYQAVHHIRYGVDWKNNVIAPQTRILTDIAAGELAQVTWVVPDYTHSDHPGSASREGPDWVAAIVNAIGNSPFWDSTAIFISWDDWGGWYDHVPPPSIDKMGPGFRVPLIVVSPYARHGYVSHQVHETGSILRFIEQNWALGSLGTRDETSDDLSDCFDFSQSVVRWTPIKANVTPEALIAEKYSGPPDDD